MSAESDGIPKENYLPPEMASHILSRDGRAKELHPVMPDVPLEELDPAIRELLTNLAEECSEVVRCCTKILRFGMRINPYTGIHNVDSLELELGDVSAISEILERYRVLDLDRVQNHADTKIEALSLADGRLRFAKVNPL